MSSRTEVGLACRVPAAWARGLGVVLAAACALVLASAPSSAAGRHAAMAIDANSGQVLHAQAADEPRFPASLTKLMTLYIAFELIEQGRLSPATRIKISEEAARTPPSKLGLEAGAEIALGDALKAIVTKSANDISVAVAEHVAGSEDKFAALMTRKARQLGMAATTFRNAHGLPDSSQVTTARDMLTLAMRLNDDFPRQYRLFALRAFSYGGSTYRNHNTMLDTYQGMDGLKTGYTTPSGFNLVASVRRGGKHVLAVVFGGSTASARNAHMRTILDRSLAKASTERTRAPVAVARLDRQEPSPRLLEPVRRAERPRLAAAAPQDTPPPSSGTPGGQERVASAEVTASPAAQPAVPVTLTKVRPVMLAPRSRQAFAGISEQAAARPVAPAPPAYPLPPAAEPEPVASEPVQAAPARLPEPAEPEPRLAAFSQPAAGASLTRGSAPSTLQVQAQRLERGQQPLMAADDARESKPPPQMASAGGLPPFRLKGPETPAAIRPADVASGGRAAIQVGAYASEADARRQLAATLERSGSALAGASPATQPVLSGGRQLYRARFVGLDAAQAATACNELRRLQIDCLVAKGP